MRQAIWILAVTIRFSGIGFAQTQDLILPVVLNGYVRPPIHYQTTIRIVNLLADPVQVTLEAYRNDGTAIRILELFPIARTGTKTVFNIEGLGSVEAFTAEDVPDLNGWLRLTFDANASIEATAEVSLINAPVGPHPICHRPSNEIITTVQVQSVRPSWKFAGTAVIRPNRQSAYAIVNPSATDSVTVFLSLLNPSGQLVGSATIQVQPQGRISRMLTEYFPNAPSDLMGSLRVTTATGAVGVGAVHVLLPEGKFTSVSVNSWAPQVCLQVLAPARNPLTNECRSFSTPCNVPEGWQRVQSCTNP